jgi:glycosyltransferase involved in cell wall biosynthesis
MRRRVEVVPNGLPDENPPRGRSAFTQAFTQDEPSWYVGYVGRLEGVKRPDRFVRVMALLPEEVVSKQMRGVVVGDGSLHTSVLDQIQRSELTHRLQVLGHRENADSLIAALDVLLIPSDHEGHPMVLLEAMRAGVPIVATAVGGVPEALGDDRWLADPDDEARMAGLVLRLLQDDRLRRDYGRSLRERFLSSFSIKRSADLIMEIYRSGVTAGG